MYVERIERGVGHCDGMLAEVRDRRQGSISGRKWEKVGRFGRGKPTESSRCRHTARLGTQTKGSFVPWSLP
jgi:hypothetical protein